MSYVRDSISIEQISSHPNMFETVELIAAITNLKPVRIQKALKRSYGHLENKDVVSVLHNQLSQLQLADTKINQIAAAIELGRRLFSRSEPSKVIDSPEEANKLFQYDLAFRAKERFAVAVLDCKNYLLAYKIVSEGTATAILVDPREIFGSVLQTRGTRLIVAHNHPTGSLQPSPEDIAITETLLEGAQILNIALLDHLIIGKGNYQSIRECNSDLWERFPQGN